VGLLGQFLDGARGDITRVLDRYLFSTVDPSGPGGHPLTDNPGLRRLTGGLMVAADTIMTAVVVFASMRSLFEQSTASKYLLKATIPRVLLAVVLIHSSLMLSQLFIDLNNALSHVALSLGDTLKSDNLPWSDSLSAPAISRLRTSQDVFHSLFAVGLVVALVILVLAYVVRAALLNVLIVTAPLAGLCTVLPETRGYARMWTRLFLTTVFMQATQLIVLRVASVTALDHDGSIVQTLYGISTLYIMLKVPGALNTASHWETKAKTMGHSLERSLRRAMNGGHPIHRATT
ncbi:MAG: conjugal transfer protein TrbL family protein, partial [Candidatus Dormibacteria bacterium]